MSEPSPIDPALLRPVLAPTLGESRTLPAEAYLSDEVFAWEERHFFEDGWVCLGRSDNLAAPATSARSAWAARASCSCATGTGTCTASSTCAATAATSCSSRAGSGTSARSSARTTRGCTASTAP